MCNAYKVGSLKFSFYFKLLIIIFLEFTHYFDFILFLRTFFQAHLVSCLNGLFIYLLFHYFYFELLIIIF